MYKYVGSGVYRIVYDIGYGYVLKVAKSEYGRWCNKKEVHMYRSSPYYVRKHLGRILDFNRDYSWIIMKSYRNKFPKSNTYRRKLYNVTANFRKNGIIPYDVVTPHGKPKLKNLRLKPNGKIIVIDYGNFRYRH